MTTEDLRQKYPVFSFDGYDFHLSGSNLEIVYFYSLPPDHKFTHRITFENCSANVSGLDNFIFHIGLSLMPSYWKTACSPLIEIVKGYLSPDQIDWWHKLFLKGMGEYFYRNNIDFTYPDFLKFALARAVSPQSGESLFTSEVSANKVLVPVGGGKDSIVTLELLKNRFQITPFIVNPVPGMITVCKIAGFDSPLTVRNIFDPRLLELNNLGYLNGHTPVSALYAFTSVLAAAFAGQKYIAFSNERSSYEGNTDYLNHTINHQYSKTLEFETDFRTYSQKYLAPDIAYFSFLRPLYELQIARIFIRFPQYFSGVTSCNRNFKINSADRLQNTLWCCHCPKCVSSALLLAAWLGKPKVTEIMGAYPPELPENREILKDLTGINPVKPFECVLTRDEAHIAQELISRGPSDNSRMFMTSWQDNPNLPPEFKEILLSAL